MSTAAARHAPATARNREPILAVLRRVLPPSGTVLEIASGTGEHAAFLARHLPNLIWQPSDVDREARASIDAWRLREALGNLRPAVAIDAASDDWAVTNADAIVCINMAHIAPWTATVGLIGGAAGLLPQGGILYVYGPYRIEGRDTAPSNEDFDASLRARDPAWGLRNAADVRRLAEDAGFEQTELIDMPANNVSLVFQRTRPALPRPGDSGILNP